MTLDEDIAFWRREMDRAESKELALVAWGISTGLRMARDDYTINGETVAREPHGK